MENFNYSVVIPYRDKYDMLVKAVMSIPDRDDIQIIIVDNSVKPMPPEKVPSKTKAKVVFTTSSPDKGAGCARNVGLSYINGRFVVFLDADDYFTTNAFQSFDEYLNKEFDIVFFGADSIYLKDGSRSSRHEMISRYIQAYLNTGDEGPLRYRYVNPIAKMIRTDLIKTHNIRFEEVRVSNDAMFSVLTGHYAQKITACSNVVYMITEGERGTSLTQSRNAENQFIRFQVSVRRFRFITSVGQKEYRPKLSGTLRLVLFQYGLKEFVKYIRYARDNEISVFSILF